MEATAARVHRAAVREEVRSAPAEVASRSRSARSPVRSGAATPVVRDPTGVQPDDFFVTSTPDAHPRAVASGYAGRWSIEVTNRDVKQDLRGQHRP